jgi:CheY-like chemotaxis protein
LPARALRMAPKPFVPTMTQRPLKVLVVEDHAVNQEVVRCLLERMGHEVTLASDGVEALEVLAHQAFDLVLMDMWMPRMDGLEATRNIRERYGSFLPVVALTANIEADAAEACAEAGMDDVLTKPIRMPALREVLDRVNRGWHVPLGQSA